MCFQQNEYIGDKFYTCKALIDAFPDNANPDEQRVFIGFILLSRKSHALIMAPDAE